MPGVKVLVVDDSWTDLTLIATSLRVSGFDRDSGHRFLLQSWNGTAS